LGISLQHQAHREETIDDGEREKLSVHICLQYHQYLQLRQSTDELYSIN
jgi:hypothetical protein